MRYLVGGETGEPTASDACPPVTIVCLVPGRVPNLLSGKLADGSDVVDAGLDGGLGAGFVEFDALFSFEF